MTISFNRFDRQMGLNCSDFFIDLSPGTIMTSTCVESSLRRRQLSESVDIVESWKADCDVTALFTSRRLFGLNNLRLVIPSAQIRSSSGLAAHPVSLWLFLSSRTGSDRIFSLSAQKDVRIASFFFASMTGPIVPHRPPETASVYVAEPHSVASRPRRATKKKVQRISALHCSQNSFLNLVSLRGPTKSMELTHLKSRRQCLPPQNQDLYLLILSEWSSHALDPLNTHVPIDLLTFETEIDTIYVSSCSPTTSTLTKITNTSQFLSHGWVPPSAASPTIIHPPRIPLLLTNPTNGKKPHLPRNPRMQKYQILVPCLPILARTPSACSTARALLQRSRPHEQLNTFRIYGTQPSSASTKPTYL